MIINYLAAKAKYCLASFSLGQLSRENSFCPIRQLIRKLNVKLYNQVTPLRRLLGVGKPFALHPPGTARLDDVGEGERDDTACQSWDLELCANESLKTTMT